MKTVLKQGLASALVEAGVEQSLAQKILRHRTTEMTMNVYAKVRSSKLLEQVMRTGLAEKSTPDEKNISETTASGADLRYTHEASPSRDPMTHPTHISGRDEGTHPLKAAEDWLSHVVIGCAFPRVPSCGADAGGSIRPGSVDSDPSAMPRGGLEPPCTGDSARLGADAVGLYYTDQIPVTTPSGRDNTRGNRVASTSPLSEAGPAARESGAAFDQCGVDRHAIRRQRRTTDEERAEAVAAGIEPCHWSSDVVRSQDAAPHGTANLTGGGAFYPDDRVTNYAGPSRPDTRSSGDLFDPHRDADRYSAVARNTKDSELKKNLLTAAASLLMAAAAMAATFDGVSRGYSNGKDCYLGNACYLYPTVTACVGCCDTHCQQFLPDCAKLCLGTPTQAISRVYAAAAEIQAGHFTTDAAYVIEAAQRYPDENVSKVAFAIAGETPFVQQVQ